MKILNLVLFLYLAFILVCPGAYAQPLDPSLQGYDEVKIPIRPKIKIVTPQTGSTVLGNKVTMEYIVSGVKLVTPDENAKNIRGEGHLVISFAVANTKEATGQAFVHNSPIVFENIPEGEYLLTAEVVKNRGDSYAPPVKESTVFRVRHVKELSPTITLEPTPTPDNIISVIEKQKQNILLLFGFVLFFIPPIVLLVRRNRKLNLNML